jgi:hypothetical protein
LSTVKSADGRETRLFGAQGHVLCDSSIDSYEVVEPLPDTRPLRSIPSMFSLSSCLKAVG